MHEQYIRYILGKFQEAFVIILKAPKVSGPLFFPEFSSFIYPIRYITNYG